MPQSFWVGNAMRAVHSIALFFAFAKKVYDFFQKMLDFLFTPGYTG